MTTISLTNRCEPVISVKIRRSPGRGSLEENKQKAIIAGAARRGDGNLRMIRNAKRDRRGANISVFQKKEKSDGQKGPAPAFKKLQRRTRISWNDTSQTVLKHLDH